MGVWLIVAVVAGVFLLPAYLFILNKYAQVGRMAGEDYYHRCKKGEQNGTSSKTE